MMRRPTLQTARSETRRSQAGVTLMELLFAMVILAVVTTMLVGGWVALQRASAHTVRTTTARASARDALARISSELRACQPLTLGTAGETPFTVAWPMEVTFYSAYNHPGANADGSGTGALRPTRIWLDTSGSSPQKTLYWQRDMDSNGSFTDPGDRTIVLARDVVNNSISNTNVTPTASYTAIFTYGYRDASGSFTTADTIASADLTRIISVQVRLIVDANLSHTPTYVDLTTTLRPRNADSD